MDIVHAGEKGHNKNVGYTGFFPLHRRPARATSVTWYSPLFFASALKQIARRTTIASDIHLRNMAASDVVPTYVCMRSYLSHKFGQA